MDWLRAQFGQHKAMILGTLRVVAFLLIGFGLIPGFMQQNPTTAGFGPDWECTAQGYGGPTCIKKVKP
jgi:hypothetical protein